MTPQQTTTVKYDNKHDVLHVFLGPPVPWNGDEVLPGIIVKRAEKDDQIVGAIIFDYSQRDYKLLKGLFPFWDERHFQENIISLSQ